MATRDRNQGFAFVYMSPLEAAKIAQCDWRDAERYRAKPIRQNLERLQKLHKQLHDMLKELNKYNKA
jgi:hypothetical protein